ncbi:hypothetical protein B484DRAFT_43743 [Ochromonadaceae sp. CCMP2298]|nr:hypothetical protein B484DRAFT_43743 [Ochromonadaceae sp. CCMP2298]
MLLVSLLFLSPAFAAAPRTSQELRALIRERSGQSPIKGASFLRKLLMGVNAKGAIRNSKAGDTRAEMTMFLNGASMALILFVWGAVAQFGAKREEARQNSNMRREVMREKEYRENMYFEAAETILKKLAEPKLKGSVKASLTKQLQEIDPDGRIRAFLEGKADRPDLSKSLEQSRSVRGGAGVQGRISDTFDSATPARYSPPSNALSLLFPSVRCVQAREG